MTELKQSCLFCGGSPKLESDSHRKEVGRDRFRIVCSSCYSGTRWYDSPDDAWLMWNARMKIVITKDELEAMWHDAELCTPNGKEADMVANFIECDKETLKCFGLIVWKEWHRRVKG